MKLEIWDEAQTHIVRTYERDKYFLTLGIVEDVLQIFEEVNNLDDDMEIALTIAKHKDFVRKLLKRIFPTITDEDLYEVPYPDIVPLFLEVAKFAMTTVSSKN